MLDFMYKIEKFDIHQQSHLIVYIHNYKMHFTGLALFLTSIVLQSRGEVLKREIYGYGAGIHSNPGFDAWSNFNNFKSALPLVPPPGAHFLIPNHEKIMAGPSPAEIASAISAAKEASSNVFIAQERVNAAKHDVLLHQRIANHKEQQAAIALQHTEAAAAVQRQQASAAANSVILAQQRLAHAKNEVAEHQRIAAEREAAAASAIQRSAIAAAAEIRKTETAAAKVAAINNSHSAAVLKHVTAAKDASLGATSAAVAATSGPWIIPQKIANYAHWL